MTVLVDNGGRMLAIQPLRFHKLVQFFFAELKPKSDDSRILIPKNNTITILSFIDDNNPTARRDPKFHSPKKKITTWREKCEKQVR